MSAEFTPLDPRVMFANAATRQFLLDEQNVAGRFEVRSATSAEIDAAGCGVWPTDPKAHVMAAVGAFVLVGGACAAVWLFCISL